MSSSVTETLVPSARHVVIAEDSLTVELSDGRVLSVPLTWYPRLWHGTADERSHWRLIGDGRGIHWPDLDEDVNVEDLLQGRHAGESQRSLKRWLEARSSAKIGPDQGAAADPPETGR
jgi:hypothetical protein